MRVNRKQFLQVAAVSLAAGVRLSAQSPAAPKAKKEVRGNAIKGTTDAVRSFIGSATLRQMPANVVTEGKRCLIDNIGVLLAGSTAEGSRILREYAHKAAGAKEATVLGREPVMVSAAHAALANAGSAHALDYDAPADPITFMIVPSALTVVILVATLVPARRAARLDAVAALRNE